jgi:hypothetical protein
MFGVPFLIILKFGGGEGERGGEKRREEEGKRGEIIGNDYFFIELLRLSYQIHKSKLGFSSNINSQIQKNLAVPNARFMTGPRTNNPRPPKHERSSRGGFRKNAGRTPGTKKQIKGQGKLNFGGPSATSQRQGTPEATEVVEETPAPVVENNENTAPIVVEDNNAIQNNGQEGIQRVEVVRE